MPPNEALDVTIQAGQGLQAGHEEDIVHRDVKSANLMLTGKGRVKVMDFGLAQMGDRSHLSKTGTTLGTTAYMSPEQALAQPTDRRTDIWLLGVVLYEMLTGQLPFPGEVEAAVAYAVVNTDPEPPTALRSGLPIEIDHIVDKALAKDREERYQHVEDLVVDLRALKASLAVAGQPPAAAVESREEKPRAAGTTWKYTVVALLLAIVLVLGWRWYQVEQRNWAFSEALPEIERLDEAGNRLAAFELAQEAQPYTEGAPRFTDLWSRISITLSIDTAPQGATIYYKHSTALDGTWQPLGQSPLAEIALPADLYRKDAKTGDSGAQLQARPDVLHRHGCSPELPRTLRATAFARRCSCLPAQMTFPG